MLPIVVDPRSDQRKLESGIEAEWLEWPMRGSIHAIIQADFCQMPQAPSASSPNALPSAVSANRG